MPRRPKANFSALPGEHANHEDLGLVRIVELSRVNGVHGATVRPLDKEYAQLPGLGMRWIKMRELSPAPRNARGGARAAEPSGVARVARKAEDAGTSAMEKSSLQSERKPATVRRRRKRSNQPTTNQRRTNMATATTGRKRGRTKAAEPEAEAPKAKRGRKAAVKEEPASNGNGRRTHEDIIALVPEIVKKLQGGTTMTEIRAEYGAGPVIRKALTEAGYNTKGEKIEVEDISDLKGQRLAKAVAAMREEGRAWYYIELAADMSEDDLKETLEEHGYSELASGRVSLAAEPEEEAPKPTGRKRGRGKAAAAEPEEKPKARGRRKARGNPSTDE